MVPVVTTVPRAQPPVAVLPQAIVFTSLHAVRHLANREALASLPVFAAADAIATAAAAAGHTTVTSTGGNDAMLCHLLCHVLPDRARVLLACGNGTSATLDDLAVRGRHVSRTVVYDTVAIPEQALATAMHVLDRIEAIVLHSRSGGDVVAPILRRARWRGTLWCISERAARACDGLPDSTVRIAPRPDEGSLLEMIAAAARRPPRGSSRPRGRNADAMASIFRTRAPLRGLVAGNDDGPAMERPDDGSDPTAA